MKTAPLSDAIIVALSNIVDDSQVDTRQPSHSDIGYDIKRAGLEEADPQKQGRPVGKAKRVKAVLGWALENNYAAGEKLVYYLLSTIRGYGGFRKESSNYVGEEAIDNAIAAFRTEGFVLTKDGQLSPLVLDSLSSAELKEALQAYVRRAKKGVEDAALLTGTSKDLLEAVAKYILLQRWGDEPDRISFPMLLGQAFDSLDLASTDSHVPQGCPPQKKMEKALFELGLAINTLRNKEGTGHGRPFLPSVSDEEAKLAIESMGIISEYMLSKLEKIG